MQAAPYFASIICRVIEPEIIFAGKTGRRDKLLISSFRLSVLPAKSSTSMPNTKNKKL
jgi:hypothetical protein